MSPDIPDAVKARVRAQAGDRCGYCRSHQRYVLGLLEIEHIIGYKGVQTHAVDPLTMRRVRLYNPRVQRWGRHFGWSADGTEVQGRTTAGRATVAALQLNNAIARIVRSAWVSAGWHPPAD
jgi:hypothetical protein